MAEHRLSDGSIRRDIGTPDALLAADPHTVTKRGYDDDDDLSGIYARTAAAFALTSYGSAMASELWRWHPEYALPGSPGSVGETIERLRWAQRMCDAEIARILAASEPTAPPNREDAEYLAAALAADVPLDEKAKKIRAARQYWDIEQLARRHAAERDAL
jgi:hypothetical protein